eukprot:gene1179-1564_t
MGYPGTGELGFTEDMNAEKSYAAMKVHMNTVASVNYQQIPVNCPYAAKNGVNNYQRDGNMRVDGNQHSAPNYFPNSFNGPAPDLKSEWHHEKQSGSGDVMRFETGGEDNFTQVGQFFRKVLNAAERERLTDNIAGNLSNAQEFIQTRAIANFSAADVNYGRMIREKIARIKATKSTAAATT